MEQQSECCDENARYVVELDGAGVPRRACVRHLVSVIDEMRMVKPGRVIVTESVGVPCQERPPVRKNGRVRSLRDSVHFLSRRRR